MAKFDERRSCESTQKEHSYFRLGLYAKSRQFGHENLCDIHVRWWTPNSPGSRAFRGWQNGRSVRNIAGMRAWFSGPNDSVSQIKTLKRSRRDTEEYAQFRDVAPHLDVADGGEALVIETGTWPQSKPKAYTPSNRFHVWLFGPLLFDNRAYGSLFFELVGPFRRDMVFRPVQLRASMYHEGLDEFIPQYREPLIYHGKSPEERAELDRRGPSITSQHEDLVVRTYNSRVQSANPVPFPDAATRYEWTVESFANNVTMCHTIRSSG